MPAIALHRAAAAEQHIGHDRGHRRPQSRYRLPPRLARALDQPVQTVPSYPITASPTSQISDRRNTRGPCAPNCVSNNAAALAQKKIATAMNARDCRHASQCMSRNRTLATALPKR